MHIKNPTGPWKIKMNTHGKCIYGSPADRKVANSSNLSEESMSGCNAAGFCPLHHYLCLWGQSWVQMMTEQSPHLQKQIHDQVLPWKLCMWASPPDEFSLDKSFPVLPCEISSKLQATFEEKNTDYTTVSKCGSLAVGWGLQERNGKRQVGMKSLALGISD